jgi:hypothetical protein
LVENLEIIALGFSQFLFLEKNKNKGLLLVGSEFFLVMEFICHFAKNVYKKKDICICIQAMTNLRTWQEEKS